jgi:hypothetical protein
MKSSNWFKKRDKYYFVFKTYLGENRDKSFEGRRNYILKNI